MSSLTISGCQKDAMEQRLIEDPRLEELVRSSCMAIMTACFPEVTLATPTLSKQLQTVRDIVVSTLALAESRQWPTRHSGTS